ncbi:Uncharacterised protein [Mycolicibacterium thermoresistibile]|jgi:hypothetical protein|nr:Uncharacterised protein [Mycolicibacterium thermoresistibile]
MTPAPDALMQSVLGDLGPGDSAPTKPEEN